MNIPEPTMSSSKPGRSILQTLVARLINGLLPVAAQNHSSIVNDVPAMLSIGGDERGIYSAVNALLQSVINGAKETSIHVSAKRIYDETVLISVKDSNCQNTYAIACRTHEATGAANQWQQITTIAFRLPVMLEEQNYVKARSGSLSTCIR